MDAAVSYQQKRKRICGDDEAGNNDPSVENKNGSDEDNDDSANTEEYIRTTSRHGISLRFIGVYLYCT